MNLEKKRMFITTVGIGNYQPIEYSHEHRGRYSTKYSPVASARLFSPEGGWQGCPALVLCTKEAQEEHFPDLASELDEAGLSPELFPIKIGRNEVEQLELVEKLLDRVPAGSLITADLTYALRHLSFLFVASLSELVALRDVEIERILYGALELRNRNENSAPLLEVTSIFRLIEWFHATSAVRGRGDLAEVYRLVRRRQKYAVAMGQDDERDRLGRLSRPLERIGVAEHSGLPLEMGLHAGQALKAINQVPEEWVPLKLIGTILSEKLKEWAFAEGVDTKEDLLLDDTELKRELRIVNHYLQMNNPGRALRVLREWVVNLVLLRSGDSENDGWLDFNLVRHPTERRLNALKSRKAAKLLEENSPEEKLAKAWSAIAELRNAVAHGGFRERPVEPSIKKVRNLLNNCRLLQEKDLGFLSRGAERLVLITPLGLSPGVLFSALSAIKPTGLLVLTSVEASESVTEACHRAGFDGKLRIHTVQDPWAGFEEVKRLTAFKPESDLPELFLWLAGFDESVINLTGGTSLLAFAAERVGEKLAGFGVTLRRVALVDRRSPEEQKRDPWVQGEMIDLGTT